MRVINLRCHTNGTHVTGFATALWYVRGVYIGSIHMYGNMMDVLSENTRRLYRSAKIGFRLMKRPITRSSRHPGASGLNMTGNGWIADQHLVLKHTCDVSHRSGSFL